MRIAALSVLASLVAASAFAADNKAPPKVDHPCVVYADRFCSNVPYGEGRRIVCLESHKSELSPACRKRVAILRMLFDYGKKQRELTAAAVAKQQAAEAAKKPARPVAKSAPPPPVDTAPH